MPLERAALADAPEVMEMLVRCRDQLQSKGIAQWDELYPTLPVVEADARNASLFVLRAEGRCVASVGLDDLQPPAYASVTWRHATDRALVVHRLGVDPAHQRRGIARVVLTFIESFARAHGFASIRLDTYTGNAAAMQLFAASGYTCVGEVQFPRRPLPFACFEKPVAPWRVRLAREDDVPALAALIPLSVQTLQAAHYSPAQREAALGPVFGVDGQLIRDGTYFVVTDGDTILGCGGWSRRRSLFGGEAGRAGEDPLLDPAREAARVRAFFVHPAWARRGLGRALLRASEQAIAAAGFARIELVATLAGEPLYAAAGYEVAERYEVALAGGLALPVVRMTKSLSPRARR